MSFLQIALPLPGTSSALLTLPQPLTPPALLTLEQAVADTLGTLRRELLSAGVQTATGTTARTPDAAEIEYASWMPDPGAIEVASWAAHLQARPQ